MMDQLHEKQSSLIAYLRGLGKTAIAFSGGVDSTFLLKTAYDALGDDVLAIIGKTVSVPNREYLEAVSLHTSRSTQSTVNWIRSDHEQRHSCLIRSISQRGCITRIRLCRGRIEHG